MKDGRMTLIAAHRGGALQWPENSPTAFRNALTLPVDQVEFDIHPTADGEIVVIHDATLDRTSSGTGLVVAHTLAELRKLTLVGTTDDRIMTLAEFCSLFAPSGITLRMEIKPDNDHRSYPGLLTQALDVLDAAGLRARTVVTSFQVGTVAEAVTLPGLAAAIWLVAPAVQDDIGLAAVVAVAEAHGVRNVGIRHNRLDGDVLAVLRGHGLGAGAWAVNDENAIRKVLALAVDVFTTDIPTAALALRN